MSVTVVTRSALLTYLTGTLHKLALKVGFAEEDSSAGYGPVLDATFDVMGYPGVNQDPQPDIKFANGARAVARYFGLVRLYLDYALFVDTTIDAPTASRKDSQVPAHIKDLITRAAEDAGGYGFPVDVKNLIELGEVLLDYNTPSITGIRGDQLINELNRLNTGEI